MIKILQHTSCVHMTNIDWSNPPCAYLTSWFVVCVCSYRRFNHFDELSGRFWLRSWAGSADSLDNPAFTRSDELLHLRALDRPCCYHDDTLSLASTCPSHGTRINTIYPHRCTYTHPILHRKVIMLDSKSVIAIDYCPCVCLSYSTSVIENVIFHQVCLYFAVKCTTYKAASDLSYN